jgi:hypothetical protein
MNIIIVQSLQALLPPPSVGEISLSAASAFLKVGDQVSHPYKKNRQHYISVYLIFKFLNRKMDDR